MVQTGSTVEGLKLKQETPQVGFNQREGHEIASKLAFKTLEDDRLKVLSANQFLVFQSGQGTHFSNIDEVFEFSLSAQGAFEFSSKVGGDLKDEELMAIRTLTQMLESIVQQFFRDGEFNQQEKGTFSEGFKNDFKAMVKSLHFMVK